MNNLRGGIIRGLSLNGSGINIRLRLSWRHQWVLYKKRNNFITRFMPPTQVWVLIFYYRLPWAYAQGYDMSPVQARVKSTVPVFGFAYAEAGAVDRGE